MSSSITVYVVSFDQLARVRGSGDRALVNSVVASSEYLFSQVDAMNDNPDPDDDPIPTCREALTRFVNGDDLGKVPRSHGYVYGYALEGLCSYLGEALEPISSISRSGAWIETIDRFLVELEVPLSLTDLVFGGSPIPIPEPNDCPAIGRWSPEQVARALRPLRGVLVEEPEDDPGSTLLLVRGWVEAAAGQPGSGLVGFLS